MNFLRVLMFSIVFGSFTSKAIKSQKWQIIKILIFLYFGNELQIQALLEWGQLFEY
jgi:hypothetical protein